MSNNDENQTANSGEQFTKYHCCAEWHLARLSPICSLVYPFAFRLSKTHKGRYTYSAKSVADFFNYNEWTVRQSYKELTEVGFFVLIKERLFDSNDYRVLSHKEWAKDHANQCCIKETMPWTGEGDPLGQALHVASGSEAQFKEHQVKFLRSLELDEKEIVSEFETFWTEQTRKSCADTFKSNRKGIIGRFLTYMKTRPVPP